jgi:hypothetical protein
MNSGVTTATLTDCMVAMRWERGNLRKRLHHEPGKREEHTGYQTTTRCRRFFQNK